MTRAHEAGFSLYYIRGCCNIYFQKLVILFEISLLYFDVLSWFFGRMDREESSCILQRERDRGVFLVRESMSINGDYVLCVKLVTLIYHLETMTVTMTVLYILSVDM